MLENTSEELYDQFCTLRRRLFFWAFISHLIFVLIILTMSSWSGEAPYWVTDTGKYAALAKNLIDVGAFSRESAPPYLWEPYRLPGYPLLIAMALRMTGAEWPVLLLAPFFAAFATYMLINLSWHLFPSIKAARATGLIAVFLPNSLGLSAMMLTDAIGGCLFVGAFFLSVLCVEKPKWSYMVSAAILWMACQFIRPVFALAGFVVLGIAAVRARSLRRWIVVLMLFGLTFLVPLRLSFENYKTHGIFSPSLLGMVTLREYLMLRVEASASNVDYDELKETIRRENVRQEKQRALGGQTFHGRLYQAHKNQIRAVVEEYGWVRVLKNYIKEGIKQILAPWDFFSLALFGKTPRVVRIGFGILNMVFLCLAIWGTIRLMRFCKDRFPLLIWGIYFYFLATGAISTNVSSRLRFPGDLLLIPLVGIAISMIGGRAAENHGR